MLEPTGGNFITLERITLDERAPAEIRLTALLAINKKYKDNAAKAVYQDVESINQNLAVDNNNLNV